MTPTERHAHATEALEQAWQLLAKREGELREATTALESATGETTAKQVEAMALRRLVAETNLGIARKEVDACERAEREAWSAIERTEWNESERKRMAALEPVAAKVREFIALNDAIAVVRAELGPLWLEYAQHMGTGAKPPLFATREQPDPPSVDALYWHILQTQGRMLSTNGTVTDAALLRQRARDAAEQARAAAEAAREDGSPLRQDERDTLLFIVEASGISAPSDLNVAATYAELRAAALGAGGVTDWARLAQIRRLLPTGLGKAKARQPGRAFTPEWVEERRRQLGQRVIKTAGKPLDETGKPVDLDAPEKTNGRAAWTP